VLPRDQRLLPAQALAGKPVWAVFRTQSPPVQSPVSPASEQYALAMHVVFLDLQGASTFVQLLCHAASTTTLFLGEYD
jgi:hypothetical protein